MVVESVGHSPYTVPDQQKQMRYTSPKNVSFIIFGRIFGSTECFKFALKYCAKFT